jgi:hypothetical protein
MLFKFGMAECKPISTPLDITVVALLRACGRKGRDHQGPGPRNVEERERERDGKP